MSPRPRAPGLPSLRGERLASLSTCHVNLNPSCEIHLVPQYEAFLAEWRNPGPDHCRERSRRRRSLLVVPELPADRLSFDDRGPRRCLKD